MSEDTYVGTISKHEMVVDRYDNITITVEGGCVTAVYGLPDEWTYTIEDRDIGVEDE